MKYILLLTLIITTFSCDTSIRTDHNWIRSYSQNTLRGATVAIEAKGNVQYDVEILGKMKDVRMTIDNLLDSLSVLSKSETIRRAQQLIDEMENNSRDIKKFYNLNDKSSVADFKLQLSLLEFELLKHHSAYIGFRDVSFDRMELRFIPRAFNNSRVTGELLFSASSNDLEDGAQMFINGNEIPIENRVGLVDIPTDELINGKIKAKITFKRADFELEETIEVIKN